MKGLKKLKQKSDFHLSVVVPIHNLRNRIENLNSWMIDISRFSIYVILVFDNEETLVTDSILKLIQDYKIDNVTVLNGVYGSPGASRNAGKILVKTDWIAFWDADDLPNLVEVDKMLLGINRHRNIDAVIGNFKIFDRLSGKTTPRHSLNWLSVTRNPGIWRWVFRSDSIQGINFQEFLMGEDVIFLMEFLNRYPIILKSNESFYTYYVGNFDQLTSDKNAVSQLSEVLKEVITLMKIKNSSFLANLISLRIFFSYVKNTAVTRIKIRSIFVYVVVFLIFQFRSIYGSKNKLRRNG